MRAMIIKSYGGPENLVLQDAPIPTPGNDDVRIKVRALGINRAETYMRKGAWPEISEVSGIECVGEVDLDPSGTLQPGQTVAAVMGGLGRSRHGSYADYTCAPRSNVFSVRTDLSWADLAAIPESYATAWICLFDNLKLTQGHVLFVRGATSALGQAAVNLARAAGATVVASTRDPNRSAHLRALGASHVLIENGALVQEIRSVYPEGVDALLDLVGNTVLRDSLRAVRKGGQVCQAGFLGGGEPVHEFNPIFDIPSGVSLSFFGSFVLGMSDFPVSAIPMQEIVKKVEEGVYQAKPARVFTFEDLPEAHRLMESNQANGKIVVVM
jgi:NADPH2:quinone reductase